MVRLSVNVPVITPFTSVPENVRMFVAGRGLASGVMYEFTTRNPRLPVEPVT